MNQITNNQEYPKEVREHKSSLFCKVFEDKKHLLDLYNSVNETDYQNPDDLEINTLENVVYLSMKNDMSFLIDCDMSLYEHQSTYNPNMPLRGLLYFSKLYNKYVSINNLNLYSSSLQKIPVPRYIVFYNGKKDEPDEQVLRLSDAFENPSERGCLECEARMLNINYGHNLKLMERCRRLEEYAIFVARVRQYTAQEPKNPREAITRAVDECIEEGILKDILVAQKAEVLETMLSTFNKELYEQGLREEGAREAEGRGEKNLLRKQVKKKMDKNQSLEEIADALEESVEVIQGIVDELKVEQAKA